MDQDGTWHGGGPWSRPHCAKWESSSSPQKEDRSPNFRPILLWPNGWVHQDTTWSGGRPQPRRLCVRWGPSYPQKKGTPTSTQFLAHVYCGQTAGWMKMPLATEADLGSCHIVLDGVPAARERGTACTSPLFSAHIYCGHGRPSQLLLTSCYQCYGFVQQQLS